MVPNSKMFGAITKNQYHSSIVVCNLVIKDQPSNSQVIAQKPSIYGHDAATTNNTEDDNAILIYQCRISYGTIMSSFVSIGQVHVVSEKMSEKVYVMTIVLIALRPGELKTTKTFTCNFFHLDSSYYH